MIHDCFDVISSIKYMREYINYIDLRKFHHVGSHLSKRILPTPAPNHLTQYS